MLISHTPESKHITQDNEPGPFLFSSSSGAVSSLRVGYQNSNFNFGSCGLEQVRWIDITPLAEFSQPRYSSPQKCPLHDELQLHCTFGSPLEIYRKKEVLLALLPQDQNEITVGCNAWCDSSAYSTQNAVSARLLQNFSSRRRNSRSKGLFYYLKIHTGNFLSCLNKTSNIM